MPISPIRPINPTVHTPEEGSYYYRTFWGAYKGHVMGMLRGSMIGAVFAGVLGGALIAGFFALNLMALPMVVPALAAIAGTGALMGAQAFGSAGYSAGAAAAVAAEEELRLRYPGTGDGIAESVDSPAPGNGHHYEVPRNRDKGKWFHWDLALPMAAVGIAIGALFAVALSGGLAAPLGLTAFLGHMGIVAEGASLATQAAAIATYAMPALTFVGGALGISYGVDRARFKDVFNHTDEWVSGKLRRTTRDSDGPMYDGYEQELTERAKTGKDRPVITTLERQEEAHRLYYDYFERSFWGSIGGNFKGFMGGPVVGALLGAAVGAAAFLVPPIAGFAPAIMALLAAEGANEGITIFARAGVEAGAQSATRETLEVKRQRIEKGLAPEVEPENPSKSRIFKPRPALIGALVGIAIGLVLAPLMGPFLLSVMGIAEAVTLPATLASAFGALHLSAATGLGLMAAGGMGGLVGATYGVGAPVMKTISNVADAVYDGRILRGDFSAHHEPCKIPYIAPNSPWLPRNETQRKTAFDQTVTINKPQYSNIGMVPSAYDAPTSIASNTVQADQINAIHAAQQEHTGQQEEEHNHTTKRMQERISHIIESRKPKGGSAERIVEQRETAAMNPAAHAV
jgi:MFS family permease